MIRPGAAVAASIGLAVSIAAYGSPSSESTLKIGVPIALSGPIAHQAKGVENGYKLYLSQHGGKLGGVPTKLFVADTAANATTTVTQTRKLILTDNVDMIGGGTLAFESAAILPLANQFKLAFLTPISSADKLTQRGKISPYFARPNMTSSQPNLYFGDYAYKVLGLRRVAIIAQDYAYGWESAGGFAYSFQKDGGHIVKRVWVPLNATDVEPYVRQLPSNVDAVYSMVIGSFVPRFVKLFNQSPLHGKVKLIGGPDTTDTDALQAMTGKAPLGIITVHEYAASLPEAASFVKAYTAAYGYKPSYWAESGYITAKWIAAAIKLQESKGTSAKDIPGWIHHHGVEFIKDVLATRIDSPHGHLYMDSYHNGVTPLRIFQVDRPQHKKVLATIPHGSQFWTETPTEYLKHPAFSSTYPPLNP